MNFLRETEPLPQTWSQIDAIAGLNGKPASQLTMIAPDRVGAVTRLFNDSELRLVNIRAGDHAIEAFRGIDTDFDARELIERAIHIRQGQGQFRQALLDAYERQCAVTGCEVAEVLEAAHIVPYRGSHTNILENGLLLRADIHTLFDRHLLTITPDSCQTQIHPDVRVGEYAALHGLRIRQTVDSADPDPRLLAQHNAESRYPWSV